MLLTHTPTTQHLPTELPLNQVPAPQQERVEHLFEAARQAPDNTTYFACMTLIAIHAGIRLPAHGELALCTCESCDCGLLFDGDHAATYQPDATTDTETVQCPDCHDEHPAEDA